MKDQMGSQGPEARSQARSKFVDSPAFVILMGALTAFDPLTIDMYLPSFPDIQRDLATSYASVELSLSAFFIGMASGQLLYGPLADRFGRKKPLLFGMILYMVSTFGCALSVSIEMLIALRVLQAIGGCAGMVITRAIVRDLFDTRRSAVFFSSLILVMGLAPILAPLIGGYINALFGWRAIFFFLGGLNLMCLLCIVIFLPETHHARTDEIHWGRILGSYGRLLKNREYMGYVVPDAAIRAGMFAYIAGSPFVFIELFHVPSHQYGWIFGVNALGLITSSQVNRLLLRRFSPDQILRVVLRFAAAAALILVVSSSVSSTFRALAIPLFLFIASLGFVGPNSIASALANQGHQAGMASALYGTLQWSVAAFSSFMVSRLHGSSPLPMTGVIAGCGLVSVLAFQTLVVRGAARRVSAPARS